MQKSEDVVTDFKLEEDSVLHCMGKPGEAASTSTPTLATTTTNTTTTTTTAATAAVSNESSINTVIQNGEMKRSVDATTFQTALSTLLKLINNVISHPSEEKYRKVKQSNGAFQRRLGGLKGAKELMFSAGFFEETVDGDDGLVYLIKPSAEAWPKLLQTQSALQTATATAAPISSTSTSTGGSSFPIPGLGSGMPPAGFPNNSPSPAAMQNAMNMLQDPNALQSMLSNPMMQQAMLNDPRIANDPMMRQSMETIMRDPSMLSNMMSNPMMRSRLEQAMSMANANGAMNMPPAATAAAAPSPAAGMGNADANTNEMMQRMQQVQQLQQFMSAMGTTNNGVGTTNFNPPPSGDTSTSASNGGGDSGNAVGESAQMTEDEMIAEAIARSLRDN